MVKNNTISLSRRARQIYFQVGFIGLLIVATLWYAMSTGSRIAEQYAPLVDAAMEIKLEATLAHLWFEEVISGDRTVAIENVWEHLDQAEWYARAMLEGGENSEGIFIPLDDPNLRLGIEHTLEGISAFRTTAHERLEMRSQSGIGSDIDQRIDATFEALLASAEVVEIVLQQVMSRHLQRFHTLQGLLMAVVVLLSAITGVVLHRHEKKRTIDMLALQDKEENLRTTLNSIGDAVITTDTEGRIVRMNPVAENLTGWSLEEAQGKPLSEVFNIVNALTNEPAANPVTRVLESGKIVGLANHTMLISRDGTKYQISDSAAPIQGTAAATGVVLVFRDVTEEYEVQEELRRARHYISNIIDSMPSILVGVDPDGVVTQWNIEAQRSTGVSAEDAMAQPLAQVFPRLAGEMERVREAMRTREVYSESRQARKEEGETRYEDVTVFPLIANGIDGAVIRLDDVTERVRIEEMMVQSEKMLSVGGLAAGMAHEINNPLGGMMQTASVMGDRLTQLDMPANQRAAEEAGTTMEAIGAFMESRGIIKMVGRICESGTRAAEIVANMLSFARKSDSTFSTHALANLLDQCVDLAGSDYDLKKKYDFRQIEIVRQYEEGLPLVSCESGKIQQVMLNILRNGAEAMQQAKRTNGGKKPKLTLRLARGPEKGMVRVEIEDNGPGMDEATCKRIFEPFFTTKPTDRGTGLGLSVSYFIVTENHGGKMTVESAPGEGTTFTVSLPVGRSIL
jgi:PAS domain S-box-containing protein